MLFVGVAIVQEPNDKLFDYSGYHLVVSIDDNIQWQSRERAVQNSQLFWNEDGRMHVYFIYIFFVAIRVAYSSFQLVLSIVHHKDRTHAQKQAIAHIASQRAWKSHYNNY